MSDERDMLGECAVSPAMVEAGEAALLNSGVIQEQASLGEAVVSVYLEMRKAASRHQSPYARPPQAGGTYGRNASFNAGDGYSWRLHVGFIGDDGVSRRWDTEKQSWKPISDV